MLSPDSCFQARVSSTNNFSHCICGTCSDYFLTVYSLWWDVSLSQIKGESGKPFKTTQFHFTTWPDHGVPDYATPILGFHRRVKSQHKPSRGPLLVHCSAGVGRTGTYIAIDNVLDQIATEGIVNISGTIVKSRNQRMKMVQTQVSKTQKLTQLISVIIMSHENV